MKDAVLHALIARWELDAKEPNCQDGSNEAALRNATAKGAREQLRACADTLRQLLVLLGDEP